MTKANLAIGGGEEGQRQTVCLFKPYWVELMSIMGLCPPCELLSHRSRASMGVQSAEYVLHTLSLINVRCQGYKDRQSSNGMPTCISQSLGPDPLP